VQNCKALKKEPFSMQEEKKSHGKADACRGFLTKHCAKRAFLKQFLSYGTSPLVKVFFGCMKRRSRAGRGSKGKASLSFSRIGETRRKNKRKDMERRFLQKAVHGRGERKRFLNEFLQKGA